ASFELMGQNAPAVGEICRRLEGIPLAIELAAARVRALPVEEVAARLREGFGLLRESSHSFLPRHQTLSATFDWSWELLSLQERALLRRLSVFAGGWTLEAAEAVCAGDGVTECRSDGAVGSGSTQHSNAPLLHHSVPVVV